MVCGLNPVSNYALKPTRGGGRITSCVPGLKASRRAVCSVSLLPAWWKEKSAKFVSFRAGAMLSFDCKPCLDLLLIPLDSEMPTQ